MRTVSNIAIVTALAVTAMWAADVITRPPQRSIPSYFDSAPAAEAKASDSSERPYHGF
jgi:hypothetical protein